MTEPYQSSSVIIVDSVDEMRSPQCYVITKRRTVVHVIQRIVPIVRIVHYEGTSKAITILSCYSTNISVAKTSSS